MSSSLQLDNSEIVPLVLQVMGLGRTAANMSDETEADVRRVIRAGLRRFYFPTIDGKYPYQWRWREKSHPIPILAIYETGTVTVSGGTVTLDSGTWPANLTDYFITVSGHVLFVTERTSDTVAAVSNTQLSVDAGTSYAAYKYRYDLPSDFGEWLGGVVYADGEYTRTLANSTESELRLRYAIGQGTGAIVNQNVHTTHYAITSTPDATAQQIIFWPVPRPDAFIQGVYLSVPEDNLPSDLTTPGSTVQVDPKYADACVECILAAAEEYNDRMLDIHNQRAEQALRTAIAHDSAAGGHYDFSHREEHGKGVGRVVSSIDFTSYS